MKRKDIIALTLLTASMNVCAQENSKLSSELYSIIKNNREQVEASTESRAKGINAVSEAPETESVKKSYAVEFDQNGALSLLHVTITIKDGATFPTAALDVMGIDYDIVTQDMMVATVPMQQLDALCKLDEIDLIQVSAKAQLLNNTVRSSVMADDVQEGTTLDLPYTGKDVIVGIIDSGIDYNHINFHNQETGETRVKAVYTFSGNSSTPTVTTDPEKIKSMKPQTLSTSHGTHVAGVAAGSYTGGRGLHGVAPQSDILLADLGDDLTTNHMLAVMKKMIEYANAQNKPLVINLSIGINDGIRHESNSMAKAFRQMTENGTKKGCVIINAVGNHGQSATNIQAVLDEPDADGVNLKTLVKATADANNPALTIYNNFGLYAYGSNTSQINVKFVAVDVTTGTEYSLTEKPLYDSKGSKLTSINVTNGGVDNNANSYWLRVERTSPPYSFREDNLMLGIHIKGEKNQKVFLSWEIDNVSSTSSLVGENTYPALKGYTEGVKCGVFTPWVCGNSAIAVGAYTNKPSFTGFNGTDYKTKSFTKSYPTNAIAKFSGFGTDLHGINYPHVVAPGVYIASSYSIFDKMFFKDMKLVTNNGVTVDNYIADYTENLTISGSDYNRNNAWGVLSGTSQSAPVVAGVVALWLEANPELTQEEIIDLIKETSTNDEFTTVAANIPGNDVIQAGYGKINALDGLKRITNWTSVTTAGVTDGKTASADVFYNITGQKVAPRATGLVITHNTKYINK